MATNTYEENEGAVSAGGRTARSGGPRSGARSGTGASGTLRKVAAAGMSADTILDIVERLGLIDVVVDRLRTRLEEVDIDELLDEIGDYLRRNPEVVVVALGTVTVVAGAMVYLGRRDREDRDDVPERRTAPRKAASSSKGGGGSSRSTTR